jgi:hypothetical protein
MLAVRSLCAVDVWDLSCRLRGSRVDELATAGETLGNVQEFLEIRCAMNKKTRRRVSHHLK